MVPLLVFFRIGGGGGRIGGGRVGGMKVPVLTRLTKPNTLTKQEITAAPCLSMDQTRAAHGIRNGGTGQSTVLSVPV